MRTLSVVHVIVLAALLTTGCGTVQTQIAARKPDSDECHKLCGTVPHVYGGTVQSVRWLLLPHFADDCHLNEAGESGLAFMIVVYPVLVPLLALDVLLSAAADTATLRPRWPADPRIPPPTKRGTSVPP
jgi:hypothetical protein